jgi:hypothetical protein
MPRCGPCRNRAAQCVYSSNPGTSRLVALKLEHKQLKLSYDNLMQLYRRLKQGSASEVSAIVERIKSSDEIPGMSEQDGMLPQFQDSAQLAANEPGLMGQDTKCHTVPSAFLERETTVALEQTPEPTSSNLCASRYADSPELPSSNHDIGCLGYPPTTTQRATYRYAMSTNTEHQSTIGFSLEYEPLLWGLLSSNIAEIRQGFLVLRSWNIEVREIHNTEEFDSLFSVLCHKDDTYIPQSRLCEMCAVAATSGQFVRHLLAPGLINYWYGESLLRVLIGSMDQG